MSRLGMKLFGSVLLAMIALVNSPARAEKSAPQMLPASTLAYVEINQPRHVLHALLDSKLSTDLQKSPDVQKLLDNPKLEMLHQVVGVIEQRAGVQWRPALEKMSGGGLVVAFEPMSQGAVLLVKPDDQKTADEVRDAIFSLARDDAKNKGNPDPIQTKTYRGLTAYHVNDSIVANLGPWMMICNKKAFAQKIADTFLDGGAALDTDEQFIAARKLDANPEHAPAAWGFVRLGLLRLVAGGQPWLGAKYKSDNPVAELLLGGLLPVAQNAPYLTASLSCEPGGLKLGLAAPSDPAWFPAEQKFFFAPKDSGAPKPLIPDGTLLSVSAYRDLAAMWQSAPDLFTEPVATGIAQADTNLSTLFGGKNFGTDVLGAVSPQMQLVVVKQDFNAEGAHAPGVRLPGAALIAGIRPDQFPAVRKHFRVGFQSIIAFANLDGSQKGRPMLEIQTEKHAQAEIQYAAYSLDDVSAKPDAANPAPKDDMYLNFSPTLAITPRHVILSSTKQLCEQLADLEAKEQGSPTIPENILVQANAGPVVELIKADREALIAKNMLEKGHDRAAAEKEVDLLQTLVGCFKDASVRLVPGDKSMRLEIGVQLGN